jgi:dihydroxyacetone kinase-like protein
MTEIPFSSEVALRWLDLCAKSFEEHKSELTALDAAIGDADHGANMARGFTAVQGKLASLQGQDIGAIFKTVAMALISTVGGASGPLYGTFFLQAAAPAAGKTLLTQYELYELFKTGLQGLMSRGKAVVGDKTMVDAFAPAAPSPPRSRAPSRPCLSSPGKAAPVISANAAQATRTPAPFPPSCFSRHCSRRPGPRPKILP